MAKNIKYGRVATSVTSASFSGIYGLQHIFQYDVIGANAPETVATAAGLGALIMGGMAMRDVYDTIRQ